MIVANQDLEQEHVPILNGFPIPQIPDLIGGEVPLDQLIDHLEEEPLAVNLDQEANQPEDGLPLGLDIQLPLNQVDNGPLLPVVGLQQEEINILQDVQQEEVNMLQDVIMQDPQAEHLIPIMEAVQPQQEPQLVAQNQIVHGPKPEPQIQDQQLQVGEPQV